MAANQSLITESTFSHRSKFDLLLQAQAAGYRVFVYHVNVQSPPLSVLRVAHRVSQGGHPVPEDKIRGRYERNQQLIRQAVILADSAYRSEEHKSELQSLMHISHADFSLKKQNNTQQTR